MKVMNEGYYARYSLTDLGLCSSDGSPVSITGSDVTGEFSVMSLPSITFLIPD